jgi:hypothetical protein
MSGRRYNRELGMALDSAALHIASNGRRYECAVIANLFAQRTESKSLSDITYKEGESEFDLPMKETVTTKSYLFIVVKVVKLEML